MREMKKSRLVELHESIAFLQLSEMEKKAIYSIRSLTNADQTEENVSKILLGSKPPFSDIHSYVRMAIYNQAIYKWCLNKKWKKVTEDINKLFKYQFKPQNKIQVFEWIVSLHLDRIAKKQTLPRQKIYILFLAMEKFNSFSAVCQISSIVVEFLESKNENLIPNMVKNLEKCACLYGCPGYLIYSLFCFTVGKYFLQKSDEMTGSCWLSSGYTLLLVAYKLEKVCEAELSNIVMGKSLRFLSPFSQVLGAKIGEENKSNKIPFIPMLIKYRDQYPTIIDGIKSLAWRQAGLLADNWITPRLSH